MLYCMPLFEPKISRGNPLSLCTALYIQVYEVLCKRYTGLLDLSYFALFLGRRKVSFLFYDALS